MRCDHDPRAAAGLPIGMYHCPDCGLMVLAGEEHPPIRRFSPRVARDDPWVDITDDPARWGDRDEFDYDFGVEDMP